MPRGIKGSGKKALANKAPRSEQGMRLLGVPAEYPDLRDRVYELERSLATVNRTLGDANDQNAKLKQDFEYNSTRMTLILTLTMDVKAKLLVAGDLESALLVSKLSQIEHKASQQELISATIVQKAKALSLSLEVSEDDIRDLVQTARKLQ